MSFKTIIKKRSFWKAVLFMALLFIVLYNVVVMLFEFGGFHFSAYFHERMNNGKWIRFLVASLLGGFIYGFIVSYGLFRSKLKRES